MNFKDKNIKNIIKEYMKTENGLKDYAHYLNNKETLEQISIKNNKTNIKVKIKLYNRTIEFKINKIDFFNYLIIYKDLGRCFE